jgi:hypothetical protein
MAVTITPVYTGGSTRSFDVAFGADGDTTATIVHGFLASPLSGGSDGVGNGSTTFTTASGVFTTANVGQAVVIVTGSGPIFRTIVSVTNQTTVVLNGTVGAATGLTWTSGTAQVPQNISLIPITASIYVGAVILTSVSSSTIVLTKNAAGGSAGTIRVIACDASIIE